MSNEKNDTKAPLRLDRNITNPKRGKYALIKLRQVDQKGLLCDGCDPDTFVVPAEAVDFGDTPDTDFFVIRLKDKYAGPALLAYAQAANSDGEREYANDVKQLAFDAAQHRNKRKPD